MERRYIDISKSVEKEFLKVLTQKTVSTSITDSKIYQTHLLQNETLRLKRDIRMRE